MLFKKENPWSFAIGSWGAFIVAMILLLIFDPNIYSMLGFLTAAIVVTIGNAIYVLYKIGNHRWRNKVGEKVKRQSIWTLKRIVWVIISVFVLFIIGYYSLIKINPPLEISTLSSNAGNESVVIGIGNKGIREISVSDILVNNGDVPSG